MVVKHREARVVRMEFTSDIEDIGAEAAKAMPPGRRYRYSRSVKYWLDNGESTDGRITGLTRPKLKTAIASMEKHIAERIMFATEYDSGEGPYWSLSWRFEIGSR